jgi:phosphate transport system protein
VSEDPAAPAPVRREQLPPVSPTRTELRTEYAAWMDRIDDELVGGALLVSEALPRVTAAFLAADLQAIAYTRSIANEVNERVRFVEDQGFLLLAREAPVAGDLRRLVSILRLITAVERSAALQRHVAGLLERVDPVLLPDPVRQQAQELGCRAAEVFRLGVDAWRRRDGLAVTELDEHGRRGGHARGRAARAGRPPHGRGRPDRPRPARAVLGAHRRSRRQRSPSTRRSR